ncbi:hypothetical protein [Kitasatospora phosalacinea]|uniref:hypothetical protein n=1 Tax=Kitasatospora phosalacinea TaxID=2065 RepID=UPI000527C4D2|nr:hypothetical protein [Kitasatospora phosalacinea]
MAEQGPEAPGRASRTDRPDEHRVEVVERGSFSFAQCGCGWFAPGRRSRDKSRRDAAGHLAENGADSNVA